MDRNVANVFHAVEETLGPCKRCQCCTGCGDIVTEGSLSWQACLEFSVQTLFALHLKTNDTPLDMCQSKSHKAQDLPIRISLTHTQDTPVVSFHGCHFQDFIHVLLANNYLFTCQCFLLISYRKAEPILLTLNHSTCLTVDLQYIF